MPGAAWEFCEWGHVRECRSHAQLGPLQAQVLVEILHQHQVGVADVILSVQEPVAVGGGGRAVHGILEGSDVADFSGRSAQKLNSVAGVGVWF